MAIQYENVKPALGALVHARRSDFADPDFAREFLDLLDGRAVAVFPEIGLSDEEQLVFTDLLGERSEFACKAPGGGDETDGSDVYKITLDPKLRSGLEYVLATYFWHMDGVTVEVDPPRATLLSAREVAAEGGQTEFASTLAAFAALPETEQAKLESLRAIHSVYAGVRPILDMDIARSDFGNAGIQAEQPLVWTHESGHKSLILGVQVEEIVGMPMAEGRAFIARLLEWATRPEFRYRHEWKKGDLVVWKNLAAMHRVIPYAADSGRLMHRTSLAHFRVTA